MFNVGATIIYLSHVVSIHNDILKHRMETNAVNARQPHYMSVVCRSHK